MKHRGCSQTVSFRLSGKPLRELERQAEEFGLSPGEMSRSIVNRYLGATELKEIFVAIEALAELHEKLSRELHGLSGEVESLRRDFNRGWAGGAKTHADRRLCQRRAGALLPGAARADYYENGGESPGPVALQ